MKGVQKFLETKMCNNLSGVHRIHEVVQDVQKFLEGVQCVTENVQRIV